MWFQKWHSMLQPKQQVGSQPETNQPGVAGSVAGAAVPQPPAHEPFQLDSLPEEWSLEWERAQLEKLGDFNLWQRTYEEMKAWEETLRHEKVEMVRSQPTLVRERLMPYLEAGHDLACIHDPNDLNEAWNYCEMLHDSAHRLEDGSVDEDWQEILKGRYEILTAEGREIVRMLDAEWDTLLLAWKTARAQVANLKQNKEKQIKSRWEQELEAFRDDYQNHLKTLPAHALPLVGYEIGRAGLSQGHSGFHGWGINPMVPFQACGWADYDAPSWEGAQGVAFRINRQCFGGRDALLYYFDDDRFPREERVEWILPIIRQCSSGISCVRVESVVDGKGFAHRAILFRLDEGAIRETVSLSGQEVATEALGGYVFVLPRCGEFYCQLGEIVDGRAVPLHIDDFCMK
ncbi:MAG: hypothetical protein E7323_09485 [Clostridiales bacterium]|nr:hypothetical protein [Clostridiales bacterium]